MILPYSRRERSPPTMCSCVRRSPLFTAWQKVVAVVARARATVRARWV